jgi:integrase
MLRDCNSSSAPVALRGPALFDSDGLPRFWAAAWACLLRSDLSFATTKQKLRYIEGLYVHADVILGEAGLDNALSAMDIRSLGSVLESYFVALRNKSCSMDASQDRWQVAVSFITDVASRIARCSPRQSEMNALQQRLAEIEAQCSRLYFGTRRKPDRVRSLPAEVVETLYAVLEPTSASNPFVTERTRWRVYLLFVLLLHQGLRRGELLALPLDALKTSVSPTDGQQRQWLTVRYNPYEDDPRSSTPSIKNSSSIRQIPVSEAIVTLVDEYVGSYRGRPDHSFLMNSQKNRPLSTEGVTKLFEKLTSSLSSPVLRILEDHTGHRSISAHHLRHTCAVFRLNQMLASGVVMEDALQRLRVFFGWSRSSDMPLRYARAVFEDRLATVWRAEFDDRVNVLRNLRQAK